MTTAAVPEPKLTSHGRLPYRDMEIIRACHHHRLLSTDQIQRMFFPDCRSPRLTQRRLRLMLELGLLEAASHGNGQPRVWWTSDDATDDAEEVGERRPFRMTESKALGPLAAHTLGVNEIGLACMATSASHGDSISPLDWDHEIRLDYGASRSAWLAADALLRYSWATELGEHLVLERFVEYDRATESVLRVQAKIRSYAQAINWDADGAWNWRRRHLAFPRLVVILDNATPLALENRRRSLSRFCHADKTIRNTLSDLRPTFTTMAELRAHGPRGHIFTAPAQDGESPRYNMRGETQ